jgi:hypothetical protein
MNRESYRRVASIMAATIAILGFAILIRVAIEGGGSVGYVVGALFVALGAGRLYLLMKRG